MAQYTKLTLALLSKLQEQRQLTIANPKPIIVAGYPDYRVVFSLLPSSNMTSELRTLETWTVVDSRVYLISYVAEPPKFIKYLPQVTQMLDSLRLSGDTTTSITTGTAGNAVVNKIINLCNQYQTLCGTPICSSHAPSVGVDTAACTNALPAVREYFNSHRSR